MKKFYLLLIVLGLSVSLFAQETELKKKVFYIDGVAQLDMTGCKAPKAEGQSCLVKSSISGEGLFTTYVVSVGTNFLIDISFLDFDEELRVKQWNFKKIFTEMYAMKVINEDGTINEANARKFSRAYDIIKDRKVIITN